MSELYKSSERAPKMTKGVPTFTVNRMLPKFEITGGMDNATANQLREDSVGSKLEIDGLMPTLWSDDDHSIVYFPKTIPSMPYEALITLLPNSDSNLTASTVDELKTGTVSALLTKAEQARQAVMEVAEEDGHTPTKFAIYQHIGPRDLFPKTPFNTSFKPAHLHIESFGYPLEDFSMFREIEPTDPTLHNNRNTFRDPVARIAGDILQQEGYSVKRRGSYSFVLGETDIDKPFSDADAVQLQSLQSTWSRHWDAIATSLTDFSTDQDGRYIPRPQDERIDLMTKVITTDYPAIGEGSKRLLLGLAGNIHEAGDDINRWIYRGVNGTLGYVYDAPESTRKLVFSPKLFTAAYRHFDFLGEDIFTKKDKLAAPDVTLPDTLPLLDIQRRISSKLVYQK